MPSAGGDQGPLISVDPGKTLSIHDDSQVQNLAPDSIGGNQKLYGWINADILYGDASAIIAGAWGGNDELYGGGGNDWLYGDAGTMSDRANGGNDLLSGEGGNDTMHGDAFEMRD